MHLCGRFHRCVFIFLRINVDLQRDCECGKKMEYILMKLLIMAAHR